MGWSSRQVWGFTALILGVIVMWTVSMVTLALFLMMGSPPEGHPLLIATPPNDEAPPPLTSCLETPEDGFVYLPQFCAITTTSPPSHPSPPSIQFLSYYNMRRCSNHMCLDNGCHGDRCCCQAIETSSLTYYCPNERGVLVQNIVEKCGCTPCTEVPVVFVGMVTDTNNAIVPMATVMVDHTHSYQANEDAIFGFSVSSLQEKVVVVVTAVGFWDNRRLLRVLPGEVNVLRVRLMEKMIRNIPPTSLPVIVSSRDLDWRTLTSSGDLSPLTSGGGASVETFIEFPRGTFSEGLTLIGQPVAMDNAASLEGMGMSFVTGDQPIRRRRRRREEGGRQEMVSVVSVGMVDMVGEEGERVRERMSGIVAHTRFLSAHYNCSVLSSLRHYLIVDSTLLPVAGGNTSCSEREGRTLLSTSLPPLTPLPLGLVLGSAHPDTCYVSVRAFQTAPEGVAANEILATPVWLLTEQGAPLRMTNVMLGETGSCVSIPCQGETEVRILDGLQYSPESYTIRLKDDVIMRSDDVASEAEIYRDLSECEGKSLGPTARTSTYLMFVLKPRQPALMGLPTPNDATLTTPPFCSLRVGVVVPVGVASVQVTATSLAREGEMVEVGVSSVDGKDVCVPILVGGWEGGRVEGEKVRLGEGGKPRGLILDSLGPDASVAMEMCKLMTETGVWFRCLQ